MNFKLYRIKALDFFSFGGLQNFAAGETSFRSGKFPPEVSRFFHLMDLEEAAVTAVLLMKNGKLYLPVPADWSVPRKGEPGAVKTNFLGFQSWNPTDERLKSLLPQEGEVFFDDNEVTLNNLPYLDENDIPKREATSGWVPFEVAKTYLEKGILENSVESGQIKKQMSSSELKVGLTLEKNTFTAEERRLYFEFVERLTLPSDEKDTKVLWEEVYLALLVESRSNTEPIKEGYYFVGGETRVGKVEKIVENHNDAENFLKLLNSKVEVGNGKLYKFLILSHTFVKNGIKIGKQVRLTSSSSSESGALTEVNFRVKWIFTTGREWLSGFNKPAIEVLQPGTVLILEANNASSTELPKGTFLKEGTPEVIQKWFKAQNKEKVEFPHFHEYGFNFGILIPLEGNN